MAAEQPETDAFLAFIERKISALQALADSYRAALAVGALGQTGDDTGQIISAGVFTAVGTSSFGAVGASYDLPTGVFLNKSMPAAIKVFLGATKKKQTAKDVATALKEGGFESTSRNFDKTVITTLHRMKENGELLQFKNGWGLAELYPDSLRIRITKEAKPAKTGTRVRKSPQRKGAVKAAIKPTRPKAASRAVNKTEKIIEHLTPVVGTTVGELYVMLREVDPACKENYVFNVLSRLRQQGKVEKRDGKWFLPRPAA